VKKGDEFFFAFGLFIFINKFVLPQAIGKLDRQRWGHAEFSSSWHLTFYGPAFFLAGVLWHRNGAEWRMEIPKKWKIFLRLDLTSHPYWTS
jgi:hypothetical protein